MNVSRDSYSGMKTVGLSRAALRHWSHQKKGPVPKTGPEYSVARVRYHSKRAPKRKENGCWNICPATFCDVGVPKSGFGSPKINSV